ncbi:MAG TPA: hypothetical protein VN256_22130 [Pyrinomonadaceae bacterium]|nr:hypothetical protein [Pyrinomonadaceae bacterium]
MKHLRRLCAVVVLAMALSFSAFAGDILTPGSKQAQPKSSTTSTLMVESSDSEPGDILTPGAVLDPVTEAALSLLQSLLSLF